MTKYWLQDSEKSCRLVQALSHEAENPPQTPGRFQGMGKGVVSNAIKRATQDLHTLLASFGASESIHQDLRSNVTAVRF